MGVLSRLSSLARGSPTLIASAQAGLLMCAGDVISQTLVEKKSLKDIDLIRTGRFGLVGFVVIGPTLRWWYGVLEKKIKLSTPAKTAIGKMAVDQLGFAPVFLCNFIGLIGILNGDSTEQIKNEIRRNYTDILITNYKIWPAAQVFNFWVVPLQHRVLFAQSVAVLWNTYLSYKTNRPEEHEEIRESPVADKNFL